MSSSDPPRRRREPMQWKPSPASPRIPSSEAELDSLIHVLHDRTDDEGQPEAAIKTDPLESLRVRMLREFVPIFVELLEKYRDTGMSLQMDASNFLEGGREIRFEFGLGAHRMHLLGTVTSEAIAFHETRQSPEVYGELVSGPMLRLRGLDGTVFRDFICERLTTLVRAAVRRR